MTHGVKNFYWRDGRPRWIIGPGLRSRGFKGQDLKDDEGNWLPLQAARARAMELNFAAGVPEHAPSKPARVVQPTTDRRGYVYFLLVDDQFVKIGFSARPDSRLAALRTGMTGDITMYVAVPGSVRDEMALHGLLARHRYKGEWFWASSAVMNCMLRCVKLRKVTLGQTTLNLRET